MELEEMIKRKLAMEANIRALVAEFEKDTGLVVDSADLDHLNTTTAGAFQKTSILGTVTVRVVMP